MSELVETTRSKSVEVLDRYLHDDGVNTFALTSVGLESWRLPDRPPSMSK